MIVEKIACHPERSEGAALRAISHGIHGMGTESHGTDSKKDKKFGAAAAQSEYV